MFHDILYTTKCSEVTLQSNNKGFFHHFANHMTEKVGEQWIENFAKLQNNKERLIKLYSDKQVYKELNEILSNVQEVYRTKSESMSTTKRIEAEQWMKKENFMKALLLYNQSIIRAPTHPVTDQIQENGTSLALSLLGRSECLFRLKRYELCLSDTKLCLKESLPIWLKLSAYWKMAECYQHLNDFKKGNICLNVIEQLSCNLENIKEMNEWKQRIDAKRNTLKQNVTLKQISTSTSSKVTEVLKDGENEKLKGASKLLKISKNDKVGRHMVAAANIKTGDTLIIEDAYASCLLPEKFGTHCQNCFKRLFSVIPCDNCSGVAFCSEECKIIASNTFHKTECKYMDMMLGSGMSILCFVALRIVTQNDLTYFLDSDIGKNHDANNAHQTKLHPYQQVYDLECHQKERMAWDFFHRTLMTLFLLSILKKSGYIKNSPQETTKCYQNVLNSSELLIGIILLKNLEVLQFNAHEIYETIVSEVQPRKYKLVNIGAGLYKTASLFNHDCYPALARYFIGTKLVMKALRPINTNEVVPENYGPSFTRHTSIERKRILLSRYWFECFCKTCNENWPTLDNIDNVTNLRCDTCKNGSISHDELKKCSACQKEISQDEINRNINYLRKLFKTGIQNYESFRYTDAINTFSLLSDTTCAIYDKPTKDLCTSHEKLRICWSLNGNTHQV